ncbi:MAG TPA: serine/threonine-protein kinase [Pyrinomonadaceae bacterium]|jgi:serine/threonine-protein kinase|nr:serine/threonine-protein kinase [Pyrinomonadaceae bacterium]
MLECPKCGRQYDSDVRECALDGTPLRADSTQASAIPLDPLIGRVLDGKYRLDERLGEGGMGTVYRAMHLLIERPVAVKVLNSRLVEDEGARERLRREARAAGRLRHTNAVAVTDFGQTPENLVYIVMELLEGRSLRDVLAREAPLDPAHAISLMLQAAAAVAAAHEAGIIHRDLKPGNIFVVQRPHAPHIVKVLDFGIAKLATDATDGGHALTLTEAGVMIGTPRYMSPEQCDGATLAPASDVYSLGVILYEMLTGETPFNGATPLAVALKHSSEPPRPPRELKANIPPALEEVVLHALEKKPANRPPDAGAFRRELYAVAQHLGLEHAAGFSAPTLETLRDAGTETPSGRLIIDIERLRQNRAAPDPTQAAIAPDTAESQVVQTGQRPATSSSSPASSPSAASSPSSPASSSQPSSSAEARSSSDASDAPDVSSQVVSSSASERAARRLRIPVGAREAGQTSRQAWLRQPLVLGVAGLLLAGLVALVAWMALRDSSGTQAGASASDDEEAVGRNLSAVDRAPRATLRNTEPRSAAEFYERGAYYFSSRNYDDAIRDYRSALELQPDFPSAHNRLGRALMMKAQFAAAAQEFREAIKKKGGNYPSAQYNLGYALQLQGDNEEAIRAYTDAIGNHDGTYPDAYFQIGIIHLKRERDAEAAEALRKAIEQNGGRDADAQFGLGVALARQKDHAGAESAFRAAIDERGGDFADAHFNLGLLYDKMGRTGDAIAEFENYLRQQPTGDARRLAENSLKELRRRAAREAQK